MAGQGREERSGMCEPGGEWRGGGNSAVNKGSWVHDIFGKLHILVI